jgi:hypothetical protein
MWFGFECHEDLLSAAQEFHSRPSCDRSDHHYAPDNDIDADHHKRGHGCPNHMSATAANGFFVGKRGSCWPWPAGRQPDE